MKTTTCSAMGGPCDATLSGSTEKEMVDAGWAHVESAHPELAATMKDMSQEEKGKWAADFHAKYEAMPEDAVEETPAAEEPTA
jgi:predicted small metal-binding protein